MTETNRKKRGRKQDLLLDISNNRLNAAPLMNRVSKEEYDNADPWLEKKKVTEKKTIERVVQPDNYDSDSEAEFDICDVVKEEIEIVRYYVQQIGKLEGSNIVYEKRRRISTKKLEQELFLPFHYNKQKKMPFDSSSSDSGDFL